MLPLCQPGEGLRVQEETSQFAPVPGCSCAEGGDSGKRWRCEGLDLYRAHCFMQGPSALCMLQMWVRQAVWGAGSPGQRANLGHPGPWGQNLVCFEVGPPRLAPPHSISVQYTSSISESPSTGSELPITGGVPKISALPNSYCARDGLAFAKGTF